MARQLIQTLIKIKPTSSSSSSSSSLLSRNLFSHKARLIEIDLDSSSSSPPSPGGELPGIRQLDDAIHSIIVRRLEPDWLPFRPGSSYWVPPRRAFADNFAQLVGKLSNPLTPEESLSLVSSRGWPSSSFFLDQGSPPVVEVHVYPPKSDNEQVSEDEE